MIVVADTGPIISLAVIDKLSILNSLFGSISIPGAVWQELLSYVDVFNIPQIHNYRNNVRKINAENNLEQFMDNGESEAVLLCKEMQADYLLIDDKKARVIAEEMSIACIGTIAVLIKAKQENLIKELRPLFVELLDKKRYYSVDLLNKVLYANNEKILLS
jgi:predicted nucleic acid-binding protein